ncbi:MAG: hypothetical protein PWP23_2828 [Candidatus Sumerlaeota bacterium]|nr:hypothetical protein [Candidatus Sumerlaeota bacterium]
MKRLAPLALLLVFVLAACVPAARDLTREGFAPGGSFGEVTKVLEIEPGVKVTIVAPARLSGGGTVPLILYALPNGNTTEQTIGKQRAEGVDWHFDIQHIGAQTRALRAEHGMANAVVAYLEADKRSWPTWRRNLGYEKANARIVEIVDLVRQAVGIDGPVILTGHSGGGSFKFGFIDAQEAIPDWIERIAFLDSNYNYDDASGHGDKFVAWLESDTRHHLVVFAYDEREVTINGKKVVSDTGGTYRATHRMLDRLEREYAFEEDTAGEFIHYHAPQIDIYIHPNPEVKILHTSMIGEMNAYMHAVLVGREGYGAANSVLGAPRRYEQWIEADATLPAAMPPAIPARPLDAPTGTEFIEQVADLPREQREAAIRHELLRGNIPDFLRRLEPVTVTAVGLDGKERTATFRVMPDYLAIGSDQDFVRMPMNPHTAQAFCDAFGYVMPTVKMVDAIWQAADVHLDPKPLTEEREAARTFFQHHRIIEGQLEGQLRGAFVAGIKKDVVISNRIHERPDRVAIYGWHYVTGEPIQPLTTVHVDWYVDYSHGIRPVWGRIQVDGIELRYDEILKDPHLQNLLSDEGEIAIPRYKDE